MQTPDRRASHGPGLRPKSIERYRYLLRRHLRPSFGNVPIAAISEARMRRWRKELLDAKVSEVTAAKAYRLLKAILNTAVDDGLIRRNPCRIKGAGQEDVDVAARTVHVRASLSCQERGPGARRYR